MTVLMSVFRWVLSAALPSCVLILLILLAKKLFYRRAGTAFQYWIWILLILRLLIPYSVQSPASALNLLTPLNRLVQSGELFPSQGSPNILGGTVSPAKAANQEPSVPAADSGNKARRTGMVPYSHAESGLAVVWLGGVLSSLTYALVLNLRFMGKAKDGLPVSDARIQDICREAKAALRVRSDIPMLYTKAVNSPALYGVIHPKLLIPEYLTGQISDEELKYILLHELVHWKRKDIPVVWLTVILKSLYWFNPLVWYAFYRLRQDCEVSCDAMVMSRIRPEERERYGHLLIHLLELGIREKTAPCSMGILPKKHFIKRRIVMISNYQKPTLKRILISVMLAVVIGATGMTGAQASASAPAATPVLPQQPSVGLAATAKEAAVDWADSFTYREGPFRFALLSDELKQKEYQDYKEVNWTLGGSSPWVTGYTVTAYTEKGKTDTGTQFKIDYTFTDSTRAKYLGSDLITVKQSGTAWQVVKHEPLDPLGYPELMEAKGSYTDWEQPPARKMSIANTAQDTANLWAEALKERNGSYRLAVLGYDLLTAEGDTYQKNNWVIGVSSPWVTSYTASPVSQSKDSARYKIDYRLTDSTGKLYKSTETITLKDLGHYGYGYWKVTGHDQYAGMPAVTADQ